MFPLVMFAAFPFKVDDSPASVKCLRRGTRSADANDWNLAPTEDIIEQAGPIRYKTRKRCKEKRLIKQRQGGGGGDDDDTITRFYSCFSLRRTSATTIVLAQEEEEEKERVRAE